MRLLLLFLLGLAALVAGTPAGFITFFEGKDCPSGWTEVVSAKGRLLLSVTDASEAGVTVNSPLADQEDRVHSHHYSTSLALPSKSVAALDCCNNQGACNDRYPVQGLFNTTTSGLPFGQLLLCSLQAADTNPVPYGTIAYFDPSLKQCPTDFSISDQLRGRFLMASYSENGMLPSNSKPLSSGEDRLHSHDYATSITTSSVSYEGINGCCNHNPAADGVFSIAGSSTNESSGLPYLQLLTCISQAKTFNSSFPKETLLFNELSCPPGWKVTQEMSGRYLVPLPDYGVPSAIYGGPPFAAGASANVSHAHSYLGTVQTRACGVGLDSGCCGSGFAGNGLYFYQGVTTSATLELPFVAAPMCKQM